MVHIILLTGVCMYKHTQGHACNPVHMPMHECIPTVSSGLTGIQGAHHFPARVYSCSEQFDVTLISNYTSLGIGGKMSILLVPRWETKWFYFRLPTKSSYSSLGLRIIIQITKINRSKEHCGKGSSFSGVVHTGTWKVHGGPRKVSEVVPWCHVSP